MVIEAARKDKEWTDYVGKRCKLIYEDGIEESGRPHYSSKTGEIEKVTKTHIIIREFKRVTAINLLKVLRMEMDG